ncbi:MAG: PAS domain-containing protein, partial [Silvanigrellaceae bacterium]|nr:PAS domain-containing protein [Silvanigrellaceae bacterium]
MMQFLVDSMPGILANVPYYIFWKNNQSVYMGCNRKFSGLLNKTPEDIIGKTDHELGWRGGEADIFIKGDIEAMQGTSKIDIEETLLLTDGSYLTLLTSKIPILDASGVCRGVLGVCIDISKQKKVETQLRLSKEAAEMANVVKTEFIANMSHDIRTPLSGVIGMSKILEEGAHTVEEMQYAHWLNESGEQLLRLLNGIVDVLSVESESDQKIKNEQCNLRECINNLVQLERPSIKLKNLELSVLIDEQVPEFVLTDPTKLHRILLNLLGNAIKFTHTGYIALKVVLVQQRDRLVRIKFSVSDSGEGIPEASQASVFERFFQAETTSEKDNGRGMGLHIAQSYVRLLGGEIKVTSRVNEGSTFYFELPMESCSTV